MVDGRAALTSNAGIAARSVPETGLLTLLSPQVPSSAFKCPQVPSSALKMAVQDRSNLCLARYKMCYTVDCPRAVAQRGSSIRCVCSIGVGAPKQWSLIFRSAGAISMLVPCSAGWRGKDNQVTKVQDRALSRFLRGLN
jgi:hypothetical protein